MSGDEIQEKVRLCVEQMPRRHNVRKISLFGSYLHGEERGDSDIDLLIELEKPVGYFELVRMQDSLESALGQKVDLITPKALSKHFDKEVLKEAKKLYEG